MFGLFMLIFTVSFIVLIVGLISPRLILRKSENPTRKGILKYVGSIFIISFILATITAPTAEKVSNDNVSLNEEVEDELETATDDESKDNDLSDILEFTGSMTATASEGKITVNIETNALDGALFEVSIIDGNFNVKSDFLEVKDGKIVHDFEIPPEWGPAYFAYNAMFRFNLDEHPQPQHIKDVYGGVGENLTGNLTSENNLNGKNATIEGGTVAYPSEEAVKSHIDNEFNNVIAEMISVSEGVLIDIRPMSGDDWGIVDVIVSDVWYYTPEHEKERFAESVGTAVEKVVINSGKADGSVMVYFKDGYGKELATPKILGGYKIQR
ncbi:hypothetical protein [Ureibacillus thermophilus]|uniref:Uncharacterized protein n=1 Tax=Ureibacillus thermophilus TaxID=367743 RepID=A0A4P6USK0_9BACL|nr:hypothetical protein [Ureibacillus thermophilus]QBK24966.1 hypothetical protein DKZ56_03230 [Ureibacillus thermophilus]